MADATKIYSGPIFETDTDAAQLTFEQVKSLTNWADWQAASLFDAMPLSFVLAVFHESAAWDTFEGWLQEEPNEAAKAYNKLLPEDKRDEYALTYDDGHDEEPEDHRDAALDRQGYSF